MASTFTPSLQLEVPARGDYPNTWDVPLDATLNTLDAIAGGVATINLTGSGTQNVNLTQAQANCMFLYVIGALNGGPGVIYYPANAGGRRLIIPNCAMNGQNLHIRSNATWGGQPPGTYGVYFNYQFGFPHPIILWPNGRPYWDYGGSYPGQIINFPTDQIPNGFLACDGGLWGDIIQHDVLFDVLGYAYGGSGNSFATPDYRGWVTAGADNMGTGNANRFAGCPLAGLGPGNYYGEVDHALAIAEMPQHNHSADHTHLASQAPHSHHLTDQTPLASLSGQADAALGVGYGFNVPSTDVQQPTVTVNPTVGLWTSNNGGFTAHNNIQPTKVVCKWIRW